MSKKPKAAAKPLKPVYFVVEKVIRQSTGEIVGALVPLTQWDQRAMRDRKYAVGTELRAILQKPRNYKFLKLAHAIGALAVDYIERYEAMETHDALKRLQRESGVCCEQLSMEIPGIGTAIVNQAQSIAFDQMDEEDFSKLVHGICDYIRNKYHGVPPDELAEIIATVEQGRG